MLIAVPEIVHIIRVHAGTQPWAGILDPARATDWTVAGIPGFTPNSIPSDSWTQSGSPITACGTSGSPVTPTACGIVAALNTANGTCKYVLLGPGNFHLSTGQSLSGYNCVELRGTESGGVLQTHIFMHGTATCQGGGGSCDFGFISTDGTDPANVTPNCNITAGLSQGSTSLTIATGCAQNITVNSTLLIIDGCDTGYSGGAGCGAGSSIDNANWFVSGDKYAVTPTGSSGNGPSSGLARVERFQREVVLVTACNPSPCQAGTSVLTLDRAIIHPNWGVISSPQVSMIQPSALVGFRDFILDDSALTITNCSSGGSSLSFKNTLNVWVKSVSLNQSCNNSIWLDFGLGADIESNYSYNAGQNLVTSGDPTGIHIAGYGVYVVNNILTGSREGLFTTEPNSGNVYAYNYCGNPFEGNGFQYPCLAVNHADGSSLNLWESNMTTAILNDLIHGSADALTLFRNFVTGWKYCGNTNPDNGGKLLCGSDPAANSAISGFGINAYARYWNLVSNIGGTSGIHTTYDEQAQSSQFDNNIVFLIGNGNAAFTPAIPGDSGVVTTIMRWGNYDTVHNDVLGCTALNTNSFGTGSNCPGNERGNGASTYPALASPATTLPPSFVFTVRTPWMKATDPFPYMGGDVTSGNIGNCNGTRNTAGQYGSLPATNASQCAGQGLNTTGAAAWGGHANAIPAFKYFLALGGVPDASNGFLSAFDGETYYASVTPATASGQIGNGAKILNGGRVQ